MRRLGLLVTGVLFLTVTSAFAQDTSRAEVSGGWRYYHANISGISSMIEVKKPNGFPKGWYGDLSFNLSQTFALVGEAGGAYHRDSIDRTSGSFRSQETGKVTFHTFLGGVRIKATQNPRLVPFGQVLFGGEHNTSSDDRTLTFSQRPSTSHYEGSVSSALLTLDSGVTVMAGKIGVRAAAGYARFFSKADADAFRFSLGAAYRF